MTCDELLAIHRQEALPVARVARQHLLPLVERDDVFHPAVPRGVGRRHAVVVGQLEQSRNAAADPPHRQPRGDVRVASGGEQRDPRAARATGDHAWARDRDDEGARRALRPGPPTPIAPRNTTDDAPQLGRSQVRTCFPRSASAAPSRGARRLPS